MRKIWLLIILFVTMVCLLSCGRNRKETLPSDQESFIQAYVAISKLQDTWPPDHPAYIDSARSILKTYNLNRESYDSKVAYFNENPERWELFYAEVLERYNETETDTTHNVPPRPARRQFPKNKPSRSSEAARR